ncbi:MAG: 3-deoxy-D-manno-octulosonate cytidylyltransferase [Ferrovum sp. 37-45-19]|uniref:3-deoxy-manno-octulosonate cytidylyltransferase n=1 Tax=Ferrovum sp. JA12 TaxID=1356299 RepID=UPI0007132B4D|nr:3-deoxy-manno-octulosonate cytidylyltransferase [Ferrovum sp. JA12]OYV80209.1 MAG: 3-deoxy-D-manno-octulosonate cytidylyltransferase [Ferrovum sp. 21-44-67]OYV94486.1 MAG: 3-deoxy-D-manno-octulosonate cytidylyltransferase [Ferrovum sp. 37-45-19]OZB33891.1 MAG: 3-deoxy-D-manno-octulosonate cytidylyltransferase [Ferrovum sp. 34-44-207]HQT81615.1 3-deoxy-manno-octulosonate cytidylyltransferase [Ferrovaceae bacterium]KRH78890.1 3-deoxy-manno-octulosonate cytidylyltransferase [Ferrovum sp. JA12]
MAEDFIAIVPARMHSTRLPRKALAMIGDYPLVIHSAMRARESGAQRVIIATDHSDILELAKQYQVECVLTREDHLTGTDRLAEATHILGLDDDQIVVNVQGDEPLIEAMVIRRVVNRLIDSPDAVMSSACYPIDDFNHFINSNSVKVVLNQRQEAMYFSRSAIPFDRDSKNSALPKTMKAWHHMGLYAYRCGFLKQYQSLRPVTLELTESLEQLRVLWYGYRIAMEITEQAPLPGVDTVEDLERVRQWFAGHGK